jgi:hypothetical protein
MLKLLLLKSMGLLTQICKVIKAGEKHDISLSFCVCLCCKPHSAITLQSPWNQGRIGMIDNIFMTRNQNLPLR